MNSLLRVPFPRKFPNLTWEDLLLQERSFVQWACNQPNFSVYIPKEIRDKFKPIVIDTSGANNQQCDLLVRISNGKNILIKGLPGTGKTWVLLKVDGTKVVRIAPTGVAALNCNGRTLHSVFKIDPKDSLMTICKVDPTIQIYIFDEVYYINPALLFNIINAIRTKNQSAQFIFSGDPLQLEPIHKDPKNKEELDEEDTVTWFELKGIKKLSDVFKKTELQVETIYLTQPMRHVDVQTFEILKAARTKSLSVAQLALLNSQVCATIPKDSIQLTYSNRLRTKLNNEYLAKFKDKFEVLPEKYITPDLQLKEHCQQYPKAAWLMEKARKLKNRKLRPITLAIGTKVMILQNGKGYVNGDTGTLINYHHKIHEAIVELTRGGTVIVERYFDGDQAFNNKEIRVGLLRMPLTVAYAMTIHKTQGKTLLERTHIHIEKYPMMTINGLLYTAVTRIKELSLLSFSEKIGNKMFKNKKDE